MENLGCDTLVDTVNKVKIPRLTVALASRLNSLDASIVGFLWGRALLGAFLAEFRKDVYGLFFFGLLMSEWNGWVRYACDGSMIKQLITWKKTSGYNAKQCHGLGMHDKYIVHNVSHHYASLMWANQFFELRSKISFGNATPTTLLNYILNHNSGTIVMLIGPFIN